MSLHKAHSCVDIPSQNELFRLSANKVIVYVKPVWKGTSKRETINLWLAEVD